MFKRSNLLRVVFHSSLAFALAAPLAAQDKRPAPPPPPIETVQTIPEPAPSRARPQARSDESRVESVFVRVFGGSAELWSGELSIANYRGASVRINVDDIDPRCPIDPRNYAMRRNGVEFRINPVRQQQRSDRYKVDVTWTRPSNTCAEMGSRATGFDLQVELPANETKTLEGDGGLRVELTRR
ncbi:MAG: hypothetical protein QNI87_05745 [Erythrobacter sp.]|uniref:hypothetical protein n=1 Tax=Erythrobacter sp. TaxID=1042 RepID=UPI00261A196D|nr:hypothetical protein [Erythrobacter sp.]MDJ0978019.1 hypothetical protein [Erythrobacter sp.]